MFIFVPGVRLDVWPFGIRERMMLVVAILLAAPLALIAAEASTARQQAAQTARDDARSLANQVALDQERIVDRARSLLSAFSSVPAVTEGDIETCGAFMAKQLGRQSAFANLGAADAQGNVICRALPSRANVSVADRAWFQRAIATQNFAVGEYVIGRVTNVAVLGFALPTFDDRGNVDRVIFANLDLAWVNETLAQYVLPTGAAIRIIDNSSSILASYTIERGRPEDAPTFAIDGEGAELLEGSAGAGMADVDGERMVLGFVPLRGTPQAGRILVVVTIPLDVVTAAATAATRVKVLSATGILVLGTILAAVYAGHAIVRPARLLQRASRAMSEGDLSARTGLARRGGEIADAGATLDTMAQALQAERAQLAESESRLRSLADAAPTPLVIVDQDGRVHEWNPAASALFGVPRTEALRADAFALMAGAPTSAALREGLRAPVGDKREAALSKRDGTVFDADIAIAPLKGTDQPLWGVYVQDLTTYRAAAYAIRSQAMAKPVVRRIIAALARDAGADWRVVAGVGRAMALDSGTTRMEDHLRTFKEMGLGTLRAIDSSPDAHRFEGDDLLERTPERTLPTCHLALGYLEGALASAMGEPTLGAELRCQSQGAPTCLFEVRPKGAGAAAGRRPPG